MVHRTEIEIRNLLDCYFGGSTTKDEEIILREYFANCCDIPSDLAYARSMFGFYIASSQESYTQPVQSRLGRNTIRPMLYRVSIVAALVAFAVVVGLYSARSPVNKTVVYCYINGEAVTDYQAAVEYTAQTLDLVASSVRKPTQYMARFENMGDLFKSLEYLSFLSEVDKEPE